MTTDMVTGPLGGPAAGPARSAAPRRMPSNSTWRLSWSGIRTVAVLELRQRVRSTRWLVILIVWALIIGAVTALVRHAVLATYDPSFITGDNSVIPAAEQQVISARAGATMFGLIVFLVLSLGALVAPALSATSINGDRQAGVLATLQTTLLSPAEIAVGKLAAAWATALALLAAAVPFVLWAYLEGGTPLGRLLVTLAVLATTLLVVCAIGLGWSAVAARTSSSAVLTYLTVSMLGLGLPVLFFLALTTQQVNEPVQVHSDPNGTGTCVTVTQDEVRAHTERVWWILAPSPYVVVADASPRPSGAQSQGGDDPLTAIRSAVREARLGPPAVEEQCYSDGAAQQKAEADRAAQREALGVTWPFGLAADLLLALGFTVLAIRRLRAPTTRLARGTRVA